MLFFVLYYATTYSIFGHQAWVRTLLLPALLGGCIGYIAVQQLVCHRSKPCQAEAESQETGAESVEEGVGIGNKKSS